jgi:hypothetical protein
MVEKLCGGRIAICQTAHEGSIPLPAPNQLADSIREQLEALK